MSWFFALLQLLGGIVLVASYPAQFRKLFQTKRADDFSLPFLAMLVVGIGMMEAYAVYIRSVALPFFVTNTLALLACGLLLGTVVYYQRRTR